MSLRDNIPPAVKRELRREVGFGCPICRSPFLTWHHFDPPYHVEAHNKPEGMIALCREHHDEADQGHYSPAELLALKKSHRSSEDVTGNFPSWQKSNVLIRVGGNYFGGSRPVVSVLGQPIIAISKNDSEMLALSFVLVNEYDQPIVRMVENAFEAYPANIHDLAVATRKGHVKVWLEPRDVGLDLSYKRVTLDELGGILSKDRERAEAKSKELLKARIHTWPPEIAQMIEEAQSRPRTIPPEWLESMPDELREAYLADDPVGHLVKSWAVKDCMTDDGLVPFLDFEQLAILHHGARIAIRDGIGGMDYNASFNNFGGVNLPCLCSKCSAPA